MAAKQCHHRVESAQVERSGKFHRTAVVLHWGWRVQGALALAGSVLLMLDNPLLTAVEEANLTLLDCVGCGLARRSPATEQPLVLRPLLGGYALVAGFVWITLEMRHLFHPGSLGMDAVNVEDAERWAWSGAWLGYGVASDGNGIAAGIRRLRLAAIAIVVLWRVLSFLGLGLVLIGLGAAYRRLADAATANLTA
jgi:uncharacterized membrane protein